MQEDQTGETSDLPLLWVCPHIYQPQPVGSEADWQSCNDINPDEILSARFAGAGTRHDQRLRLNVITPAKRKRARLESSRLRAPNTISQSSLGTRNEGRRVSTSSRRK